jgi:hypothetical protein
MKSAEVQRNNIIENYRKTTDYPKLTGDGDIILADFGNMEEDVDGYCDKLESEINQKLANIDGLKCLAQIDCGPSLCLYYEMLIKDNTDDVSHNEKLLDNAINVTKDVFKSRNIDVSTTHWNY